MAEPTLAPAAAEYLGDGVYVTRDKYGRLVLTTSNGLTTTNEIVLEPEVYAALVTFEEGRP